MAQSVPSKCPGCGATVVFNPGQTTAVCEYCSNRVLLSDVMGTREGAATSVHMDLEKKKMAVDLLSKDLSDMRAREKSLKYQVDYNIKIVAKHHPIWAATKPQTNQLLSQTNLPPELANSPQFMAMLRELETLQPRIRQTEVDLEARKRELMSIL